MIANLLVIVFILLMPFIWHLYGMFSAFLHLMIVIISGALAFGLWEPLAYWLLGRQPHYAWGVALIAPFILFVIVFRVLLDKLVPGNLRFHNIADRIGGAFFGFLSAILTVGVLLIGLSFLPLSYTIAGYQRLDISARGEIVRREIGLWIPVDTMTASFYRGLSGGAFFAGDPMRFHLPELTRQASLFRISRRAEHFSSLVAPPATVSIDDWCLQTTPLDELTERMRRELLERVDVPGARKQLVAVTTEVRSVTEDGKPLPGLYDTDATLRMYPNQVRLVGWRMYGGDPEAAELFAPVAAAQPERLTGEIVLNVFTSDRDLAWTTRDTEKITWVFVLPETYEPQYLLVRRLRLWLPESPNADPQAMAATLGQLPTVAGTEPDDEDDDGTTEPDVTPEDEIDLTFTNEIPQYISVNDAQGEGMEMRDGALFEGQATIEPRRMISRQNRSDEIWTPTHFRMVRIGFTKPQARYFFYAQARDIAGGFGGVFLQDVNGEQYLPMAYVRQQSNNTQTIVIRRTAPFRSAEEFGARTLDEEDRLYLYFQVPPGVRLQFFRYGNDRKVLNVTVPQ